MNKKINLFIILTCIFKTLVSFGQTIDSNTKSQNKLSKDIDFEIDIEKRTVEKVDSLFKITDFYKNGNIAKVGYSKEIFSSEIYYKREGRVLKYFSNGNLLEEATFNNDEYIGIRKEFFENGKIYKKTKYEKLENQILPNVIEVWDINGKQLVKNGFGFSKEFSEYHDATEEGIYKDGVRDSTWVGCYENGKLCYKEIYDKGKLLNGISYDLKGKEYSYKEIYEVPYFKGGINEFGNFLSKNLVYPKRMQRLNIEGKVYIKFVVEKDGRVTEAFPIKSVHPTLDYEAVRVIKLSSGQWQAGKNRAIPVRVWYTIPIYFMLE